MGIIFNTTLETIQVIVFSSDDIKKRNTVIFKENNNAFIIDPSEDDNFYDFIKNNDIKNIDVLYSHSHINHLLGVKRIKYNKIISSHKLNDSILKNKLPIPLSQVQFKGKMNFIFGGKVITLINLPGHLDDLCVAFFKDLNLVFSSDLILQNCPPFIGDGDSTQYLKSLDTLMQLKFKYLIPGHGHVMESKKLIKQTSNYIYLLQKAIKKNDNIDEIFLQPFQLFSKNNFTCNREVFHKINIKKIWVELKENGNIYDK